MMCETERQIWEAEESLRRAMLASDVAALEALLADELIFTSHLGRVLGKSDDLAAHRSGVVRIESLENTDPRLWMQGDAAVVSVRSELAGRFASEPGGGTFRFTRVWSRDDQDGAWRVVAAHSGIVS